MSPARGDRKPCMARKCPGTMQFGRQSQNHAPVRHDAAQQLRAPLIDPKGWVCERNPEHFREAD
jgi:hypothetical protein